MRELLERLFQIDFIKGLIVTFRMQNPKEVVTEQYPLERPMVAERYRGAPRLNNNPETGETLCIGCNLCALACPENLIVSLSHCKTFIYLLLGSLLKGMSLSTRMSGGRPSTRSAMTLRRISSVPPAMRNPGAFIQPC